MTATEREIALDVAAAYMAPVGSSGRSLARWQLGIDEAEARLPETDRGGYVQAVAHRLVDLLEARGSRTGRGRRR